MVFAEHSRYDSGLLRRFWTKDEIRRCCRSSCRRVVSGSTLLKRWSRGLYSSRLINISMLHSSQINSTNLLQCDLAELFNRVSRQHVLNGIIFPCIRENNKIAYITDQNVSSWRNEWRSHTHAPGTTLPHSPTCTTYKPHTHSPSDPQQHVS